MASLLNILGMAGKGVTAGGGLLTAAGLAKTAYTVVSNLKGGQSGGSGKGQGGGKGGGQGGGRGGRGGGRGGKGGRASSDSSSLLESALKLLLEQDANRLGPASQGHRSAELPGTPQVIDIDVVADPAVPQGPAAREGTPPLRGLANDDEQRFAEALATLEAHICSAMPGRLRVRHDSLRHPEVHQELYGMLVKNGVHEVRFTAATGSCLILYDPNVMDEAAALAALLPLALFIHSSNI